MLLVANNQTNTRSIAKYKIPLKMQQARECMPGRFEPEPEFSVGYLPMLVVPAVC